MDHFALLYVSKYFQAKDAQPQIDAFIPKGVFTEESEVDATQLQKSIDTFNVTDAITIYQLLTKKNIPVTDDLKQSLLELVCFYNHKNPLPFDMFEERALAETEKMKGDVRPEVWAENSFAEELFNSMESKTPAAYNAIIRGIHKHNNHRRADELCAEAKEKQIPFDLETYNERIRGIRRANKTVEIRYEEIKAILAEIKENQIKPDVHTLNVCLGTIKVAGNLIHIQSCATELMAEFSALNIEPSLQTYAHLLDIYHSVNTVDGTVLPEIVNRLEQNPNLVAQSSGDVYFFSKAMQICNLRMKNSGSLARRIDNIVTHANNIKFLGNTYQQVLYYRHFLSTILKYDSFTEFLSVYDELVPETYSVETSLMDAIITELNINGQIQHVPKFWQHMQLTNLVKNTRIIESLLGLMISNRPVAGLEEHIGLNEQFAEIAWGIYRGFMSNETMNETIADRSRLNTELVPCGHLSSIIILLLRAGNVDNYHNYASSVIEYCLQTGQKKRIIGHLSAEALDAYLDSCIARKVSIDVIRCLSYAVENGIGDQISYARKIIHSFTLEPQQIREITDLVGNDALKTVEQPKETPVTTPEDTSK